MTNNDSLLHTPHTPVPEAQAGEPMAERIAAWNEWREERTRTLSEPHGWLTLISFTWLSEERMRISDFPGVWYVSGDTAAVSFQNGTSTASNSVTVLRDGEPYSGEVVFNLKDGESDLSLSAGTRVAEVAVRGGRYCVRVRDSSAPTLAHFTGVPVYDYDPSAVVPARFESFGEPLVYIGTSARKGVSTTYSIVGDVIFTYAGVECRLAVSGDPAGELQAVFYDETNGTESADWRSVRFPGPDSPEVRGSSEGDVRGDAGFVIDFNRSQNYPAAFTPFGTCPKPIDGNTMQVPVRAGERRPAAWIDPFATRE
ncbi:DUF1684 domain-containing protein [Arcanobacterium haemolyticum]|nr:DUF1684 domain-containing protein [Arcanobacterium haemolyticum]